MDFSQPVPTFRDHALTLHDRSALRLEPRSDWCAGAATRFPREAVMAREPVETELQDNLGRTQGPAALAFDVFETFEKAADVEQHVCEFRTDRLERAVDLLASRDNRIGEGAASALTAPTSGA